MRQDQQRFTINTHGKALYEFTDQVADWLAGTGIGTGMLTLFCRHTSASLLINENAAPAVQRDLQALSPHRVHGGPGPTGPIICLQSGGR